MITPRSPVDDPPTEGQLVIFNFKPLPERGYELRDSPLYLGRFHAGGDRELGPVFQTDLGPFLAALATAWWPAPSLPEATDADQS